MSNILCRQCQNPIKFDDKHISQRTGKDIPLDVETNEPHDCPVRRDQQQQEQQPFLCLFQPVEKLVRSSLLKFKLGMQLSRQSHIVPSAPISSTQATNGLVTHWLPSYIADQLFIEMCEAEIDDPGGIDGEKSSKYYIEAAKYAGRISAGNFEGANAKYRPVFEIHYNDFTARLQEELKTLLKESPSTLASVVESAVFRIFKARHKLIFYDYIENDGLNWRFVAAD